MRPRRLLVEQTVAINAMRIASEKMGQPAMTTANSVRIHKTVGLINKRTETGELIVRDGIAYLEADSDAFEDWARKVIYKLSKEIIDDQGVESAYKRLDVASRLILKNRVRDFAEMLDPQEVVHDFHHTEYNSNSCLLAITDQRLLLRSIGIPPLEHERTVVFDDIVSISVKTSHGEELVLIQTHSGKLELEFSRVGAGDHIQTAIKQSRPGWPNQTSKAGLNLEALTKLAELYKSGILTDEEYAAGKAKILGL